MKHSDVTVEMKLQDAYKVFPKLKEYFPLEIFGDDDDYIIRISPYGIEVGYASDKEWVIPSVSSDAEL